MDSWMMAVALIVGIAVGSGLQQIRVSDLKTTIATMEKDQATAVKDAAEAVRQAVERIAAKNQDLQNEVDSISKTAKDVQDAMGDQLDAARLESERLRQEIDRHQARDRATAGEGTDAARELESARETNRVLAKLLGEVDQRSTAVAEFADRSYLAAESCQRSYQTVRDYTKWP